MEIKINLNEEETNALEVMKEMSINYEKLIRNYILEYGKFFYEVGLDYDTE